MVEVRPFRGVRYSVEELSRVVAPPYDVISEEELQRYYSAHPNNVVWLDLNPEAGERRYRRAAELYREWKQRGVLVRDAEPCIYFYTQEYTLRSRRKSLSGIIASVRLSEYTRGEVLPHERTLREPKRDRLMLMRHTGAVFSPIYMLHELEPFSTGSAELIADFEAMGVRHRLWRLEEQDEIAEIAEAMKGSRLFIADGHHRYETALSYAAERGGRGDEPHHYVPAYMVSTSDPGVSILPAHRLVRHPFSQDELLSRAEEHFEHESFEELEEFLEALYSSRRNTGFYAGEGYHLLTLKDYSVMDELLGDRSPAVRRLPVSVLHSLVFSRILGFESDEHNTSYSVSEEECVRLVERREFDAVFFLNPTTVQEVCRVAEEGERMPGKATYFYPKPLTGLVMYELEEW